MEFELKLSAGSDLIKQSISSIADQLAHYHIELTSSGMGGEEAASLITLRTREKLIEICNSDSDDSFLAFILLERFEEVLQETFSPKK